MNKKLKKAVIHEVKMLRKYATEEEIEGLDIKLLDPENTRTCIYGQMTGDCYSKRASELINKCSNKYVFEYLTIGSGNVDLNYKRGDSEKFTALERRILEYPDYNPRIIAALKGGLDVDEIFN